MAGSREIKAGKAAVEIIAETDPLKRSLAKASAQFRTFGSNLSSVSGMVSGLWAGIAGSAAVGALGSTVKAFADIGSAINDMSLRTGVGAEQLQHLTFAAKQSGASMEALELGLRNMARKGFNVADFEKMGQKIAAIGDPSERAAKAMEVFGKSGTALIPMFRDWNSLKASSLALGPILSAEEVKRADESGDSIGALSEAFSRLQQRIGSLQSTGTIMNTITGFIVELNENLAGNFGDVKSSGNPFTDIAEMFTRIASKGKEANAAFESMKSDEALEAAEKTAMSWDKIADSIRHAHEERNRLIREFDTPAEQFLRKQKEIFDALAQLRRNRVLGFVGDAAAGEQQAGLDRSLARLREQEAERRLALIPKLAQEAARGLATSSRGTFSAAGAALLGRGGDPVQKSQLDELKLIRQAVQRPTVQRPKFT